MDNDLAKKLFDQEMMEINEEDMKRAAKSLHQLYGSFIEAGFNKMEAMQLVFHMIDTSFKSR